jgi:hypothetical protein
VNTFASSCTNLNTARSKLSRSPQSCSTSSKEVFTGRTRAYFSGASWMSCTASRMRRARDSRAFELLHISHQQVQLVILCSISAIISVPDDRLALQEIGANIFRWLSAPIVQSTGESVYVLIASMHFTCPDVPYKRYSALFRGGILVARTAVCVWPHRRETSTWPGQPTSTQLPSIRPFSMPWTLSGGGTLVFEKDSSHKRASLARN